MQTPPKGRGGGALERGVAALLRSHGHSAACRVVPLPLAKTRSDARRSSTANGRVAIRRSNRPWGAASGTTATPRVYRIVGVVEGTKSRTLGEDPLPQLYEKLALKGVERSRVQLIARVTGPPALAVPAVRAALRTVEPAAGVTVEPIAASLGIRDAPEPDRRNDARQPRAARPRPGGGRTVRRDRLFGDAAHARDRHPHGRRCRHDRTSCVSCSAKPSGSSGWAQPLGWPRPCC